MADFSMANGGYAALGQFASSYFTAQGNRAVASIQADASNTIRGINNETAKVVASRNAVLTATQKWAQGVRNARVYEAVGANQEALAVNFNRQRDARTRSNFAASVRQAEESGRQQAAAAASGVTGSVVDIIDTTARLRNGITEYARVTAENQSLSDYKKTELAQRLALLDNLDYTAIFDQPALLDYGTTTERQTVNPISAGLAGAASGIKTTLASFNFNTQTDNGLGGLASSGSRSMGD